MSSISTVAPASTTTSTPEPPLKTIIRIVAHGSPPLDLSNYAMHQPIEDGVPVNGGVRQGSRSGALANNPFVKYGKDFVKGGVEFLGGYATSKAIQGLQALWSQNGPALMSSLASGGQQFVNFLNSVIDELGQYMTDPASGARSTSAQNSASSTLTPAEKAFAQNLVTAAQKDGVLSALSGAVQAVYAGMQSAGSIVDTTA